MVYCWEQGALLLTTKVKQPRWKGGAAEIKNHLGNRHKGWATAPRFISHFIKRRISNFFRTSWVWSEELWDLSQLKPTSLKVSSDVLAFICCFHFRYIFFLASIIYCILSCVLCLAPLSTYQCEPDMTQTLLLSSVSLEYSPSPPPVTSFSLIGKSSLEKSLNNNFSHFYRFNLQGYNSFLAIYGTGILSDFWLKFLHTKSAKITATKQCI